MNPITRIPSAPYAQDVKTSSDEEKRGVAMEALPVDVVEYGAQEAVEDDEDVPFGVKKFLAMKSIMTKKMLYTLWFGIWISYFVFELDNVSVYQYLPYATSSFGHHSLLSAISVAGGTMASVGKPVFSKLADVLGRGETYIICTCFYVLGYILMSTSPTIGAYGAGYVFYCLGQTGTQILNVIVIADITSTRWRSLATSGVFITYIVCVWVSSEVVSSMLATSTWRWGVRIFIFILPPCISVIVWTLFAGERNARGQAVLEKRKIRWNALHLEVYGFCSSIDIGGLVLLAGGCALILVSCSLAATLDGGWGNPAIIACLVLGPLFLIGLPFYEKHLAKHPIIPFSFFANRQLMLMAGAMFCQSLAGAISSTYLYSWMVVTQGWSTQDQTYFTYANGQVQTLLGIFVGVYMFYFRRYKWINVAGAVIYVIGFGIQLAYRTPQQNRGLLVMVQVILGTGTGITTQVLTTVSQFEVKHKHTASVIAFMLLVLFVSFTVGDAVAGAMWTNLLPGLLRKEIPAEYPQSAVDAVFGDIFDIPDFGDPVRDGMIRAYMQIMRSLTIASLAISILPIGFCILLKNRLLTDGQNLVTVDEKPKDMKAAPAEAAAVVPAA